MSDLHYYTTDEFLNLYVKGDKSIDEMLSLDNLKHTTTYRISFLNHLLYLCKHNNTSLLDMMNSLKDMIVNYMKRLINENFYIKSYIETIIKEWSLILEADDIFDDIKGEFKYDDFIIQNKMYNELV